MIISISGVPGSGKTSIAKLLAARLGVPFFSMGGLRGKMALERGITLDELNKLGETDATTDTSVDDYQRELGKKENAFVIEGRLSWHFIPHSFKIFLDCDPREAARRIFEARQNTSDIDRIDIPTSDVSSERQDEPLYGSAEDAERDIANRVASDDRRYAKYYGVNYRDPSHYDLVFDTTKMKGAEETADAILARLQANKDFRSD